MKKILVGGITLAVLLAGTSFLLASAQDDSNSSSDSVSNFQTPAMVLEVNKNGKILLRGTIDSVSSGSLTVKSWGGNWIINISSSTELMPNDIAKFVKGDFVGVQGTVSTSSVWTINAKTVRDWSSEGRSAKEKETAKSLMPRNWEGTISNINVASSSFTLTAESAVYTVNLASGAQLYNKNKSAVITLANVKSGDRVRVYGTVSSSTITASVFRDTSL